MKGVEAATVSDHDEEAQIVDSFEGFFAAEYRRVVALAAVLSGRRSIADELAQESFLRAYKRWDTVRAFDDPAAWVRRVLVNVATSSWRTRVREAKALARVWRQTQAVELPAADDELWRAVRSLPARQAQCLALHYLEDRAVDDIAQVLGIAPVTVRVHLHQGRLTLAERLGDVVEEDE